MERKVRQEKEVCKRRKKERQKNKSIKLSEIKRGRKQRNEEIRDGAEVREEEIRKHKNYISKTLTNLDF